MRFKDSVLTSERYSMPRFKELDGLRGVAILAVVIYHFGVPFNTWYPSSQTAPYSFVLGETGVQLFFMISGFVILLSAIHGKTALNFLISRFTRLYPTYWVSLIVASALLWTIRAETHHITVSQVVINFSMVQRFLLVDNVDLVYWTLAVEMQFYMLMLVYLWLSKGQLNRTVILWFSLIWSTVGTLLCLVAGPNTSGALKMLVWAVLAEHAPLFSFGMAMFLYRCEKRLNFFAPYFAVLASLNAGVMHSLHHGVAVAVLALLFFVVVSARQIPWLAAGPLQYLGKISYSLYLNHEVVGFVLLFLLIPYLGNWWARVLAFAIVILWSTIINKTVENMLSKRLKDFLVVRLKAKEVSKNV